MQRTSSSPEDHVNRAPHHLIEEGQSRTASSGYWYAWTDDSCSSIQLLNLLREYREVESAMRARTQDSMRMSDTDLRALRFLLKERSAGHVTRQKDLAAALKLTAATTTTVVDRLSAQGYIQRVPHPDDRRSVALEVLPATDREVKETLSRMHADMIEAAENLTDQERAGAAKFITNLIRSVNSHHPHH